MTTTGNSTVGRDDFLMEQLAKKLLKEAQRWYDYTPLRRAASRRGYSFDVRITVDGEPTGHVARVTVELLHFEAP
jgi:hypothetical protein